MVPPKVLIHRAKGDGSEGKVLTVDMRTRVSDPRYHVTCASGNAELLMRSGDTERAESSDRSAPWKHKENEDG